MGRDCVTSKPVRNETRLMSAAVITAPGVCELRQVAIPQPGPGQVRVRIEGCGVCASNIPPWEGRPWFTYPMPPGSLGHESWGLIDKVGEGVTGRHARQRVATLSTQAFAEYIVCPAEDTVVLPDVLANEPFPGEPLACAVNVFERADIQAGQHVAVVGIGFLGALLTRMASSAGAGVTAISRRDCSLDCARQCGARRLLLMEPPQRVLAQAREATDGRMFERVIEATGTQVGLDLASDLVAERGRLIIAGYHQDGPRTVNMQSWNWRGIDVINAHERDPQRYRDGLSRAVQMAADGDLDARSLYTHRFALAELGRALDTARDRPDGFIKALVLM